MAVFVLTLLAVLFLGQVTANTEDVQHKELMADIAGSLKNLNELSMQKVEDRMLRITQLLTNIDANVKSLQSRAHVWDTFQLHVAAWNEQLNTLDRKVDILSRGQESFTTMDTKINSLTNLNVDYKLERLLNKMADLDNKMAAMRSVDTMPSRGSRPPDRYHSDIMQTLKTIEKQTKRVDTEAGRLVIKCNTPARLEELLTDVAAKMDVIYDKIEVRGDEDEEEMQAIEAVRGKNKPSNNALKISLLESIDKSIRQLENSTVARFDSLESSSCNCCQSNWNRTDALLDRIHSVCVKQDKLVTEVGLEDRNVERIDDRRVTEEGDRITTEESDRITTEENDRVTTQESDRITAQQSDRIVKGVDDRIVTGQGCEDLVGTTATSGVFIFSDIKDSSFARRYCQCDREGGEWWTVIQRRGDYSRRPRQNFSVSWNDYRSGFGDLEEEFWYGNDFIHRLTGAGVVLRVQLAAFSGDTSWAEFNTFRVGDEEDKYRLHVGGYTGNATDSFTEHDGVPFSTVDRKNDAAPECCPCAPAYGGGWWFDSCFESNLNGDFYPEGGARDAYRGMIWEKWLDDQSLMSTWMMISRPRVDSTPEDDDEP